MLDSRPLLGIPEYTLLTVVAVVAVVLLELAWLRTGVFRTAQYWVTMAIVFAFQVPVDGWLTKLRDPIVIYNERQLSGLRLPWDIPVEDFGFGFAMVTLAILLWRHRLDRPGPGTPGSGSSVSESSGSSGSSGPSGPGQTVAASTTAPGQHEARTR